MNNHPISNPDSKLQGVPEIEEIEGMLRTYHPNPDSKLADKVANSTWMKPANSLDRRTGLHSPSFNRKLTISWSMSVLVIVVLALLMAFTNIGQSLAESISRFFKVSSVNYFTEVVRAHTGPTSSPNYPYDQFTLSIEQAEALAGFEIKNISDLPSADWVFHGAKVQPEVRGITLFYSLPFKDNKPNQEAIYLFISEQKNQFDESQWWGECPKSAIKDLKINNWPAQLADGTTWQTETEPTPGVERLWICRVIGPGVFMTLRWEETDLKYEISVQQIGLSGEGADMNIPWLTEQDLIHLAENLK